jgi:predicted TIM-barrel fold metal-dependent hydrolase
MPAAEAPLPLALPPDPNTRAPDWALPEGAWDTHFHVFGPPERFPFAATRRYEPPPAPIEDYWRMAGVTGLARGVIVQPTAHGFDNAAIVDAIARSNGNLVGIACIEAAMPDAELEAMQAAGIRGARFPLMSDRPGSQEAIAAALPRIEALGWSLVLHIEPEHLLTQEGFIRDLPVTTVIDHIARIHPPDGLDQPAFALLLDLLKEDRFWTKICCVDKISAAPEGGSNGSVPYADVIPYARAVIEAAPGRVIWGSDWPHGNTFAPNQVPNEGDLLNLLGEIVPDDETRCAILVDNPTRLYEAG